MCPLRDDTSHPLTAMRVGSLGGSTVAWAAGFAAMSNAANYITHHITHTAALLR